MTRQRRRPPPDHLTAMGTSGLAGPGFTPDDVFARHARPAAGAGGPARLDARVRDDVCDALTDDPALDASAIEVTADGGVVTLAGTVPTRAMRARAGEDAEAVAGVDEVDNQIRVRRAPKAGGR